MTHPLDLIENLAEVLISDQVFAYQKLQQQLARLTGPDSQLVDELAGLQYTLVAADQAAQENYAYQKASDLFLRAFRLDPHNQNLYWLAELARELAQASQEHSDDWPAACDHLAGQTSYNFKAAQYYLEVAKDRINESVLRVIQLIRAGLLDAAQEKLRDITQTWGRLPAPIQCVQNICDSYWYLYDYSKLNGDVEKRLPEAETALNQAKAIPLGRAGPNELSDELTILETLVQIYRSLYQANLSEFEPFKNQLQKLPVGDDHVFIKRLDKELDSLNNWKRHHEQVFNYCLNRQYGQASGYLQQLTDLDKEAIKWFNPTTTPDLSKWENFCAAAQRGLEYWQNHRYAQARAQFSMALEDMPIYLDGNVPATLLSEFETIVQDLTTLQLSLTESYDMLGQATAFEGYNHLPEALKKAQQVEERYRAIWGGEAYIHEMARRASQFIAAAQKGDLEKLQNLTAESKLTADPLLPGYGRITSLISKSKQANASLEDVETALKLAPDSTALKKQREDLTELIRTTNRVLEHIHLARFEAAWDKLEQWDQAHAGSPPAINCLWHLCAGYDCLVGPSGQALSVEERLKQTTQFLEKANHLCKNCHSLALSQESNTLSILVGMYRRLNQQGLVFLQTAKTELSKLQNKANVPANHAPIRIFADKLTNLDRWRSHRERIFDALSERQYGQALEYLKQISAEEKRAIEWLNGPNNPSWNIWEAFCFDVQRGFTLWQGHKYKEAWAQIAYVAKKIPSDLPQVQLQILQEQFEEAVRDLVTIETCLNDSLKLLKQANDAQLYEQIAGYLDRAIEIENNYFQSEVTGPAPVIGIIDHYNQFKEGARQGDEQRLQSLITKAIAVNDPLAPGYEHIKTIIERGRKGDASRENVQAAWKLAPNSDELAKKIEQFETDEIVERVLKNIRGGRLERAGQLLDTFKQGRSHSLQFQCLLDIYQGYQHLYGYLEPSPELGERISMARQAVNMVKNCPGPELAREHSTLKALVHAYGSFHAKRWQNLEQIGKQLQDEGASHVFVVRLKEEIEGLGAWRARRQRVLDNWYAQQYIEAWAEFENVTEPEKMAFEWLDDSILESWQAWQDFCQVASNGLESWRKYDYQNAQNRLGLAATRIPSDLNRDLKTTLETYLNKLVVDLNALQRRLRQVQELLRMQDAKYYDQVAAILKEAQEIEKKYYTPDNANPAHIKRIADRYDEFKRYALVGDVKQLGSIFQASISDGDLLSEAYERIRNTINSARQPRATHKQIMDALQVAPQDPTLIEQREQLEHKRKVVFRTMAIVGLAMAGGIAIFCLAYLVYLNSSPGFLAAALNLTPTETPTPPPGSTRIVIRVTATPPPPTATPAITDTPAPTASPTSFPTPTLTASPTPLPSPSPTFTAVPQPTVPLVRSGRFLNLFDGDLGGWATPFGFNRNSPSLYLNAGSQWNIWTADQPHEFWLQQPVQTPLDFAVSMNVVRLNSRYGLVIKDQESGEKFSFYVQQAPEGQWTFDIRQGAEVIAAGPLLTYSQTKAPFNNLTIRSTENAINFVANITEVVHTHQLSDNFKNEWQLGLAAGANAHAIIGSARVYELVPAR